MRKLSCLFFLHEYEQVDRLMIHESDNPKERPIAVIYVLRCKHCGHMTKKVVKF